jgi:hypothetical protein
MIPSNYVLFTNNVPHYLIVIFSLIGGGAIITLTIVWQEAIKDMYEYIKERLKCSNNKKPSKKKEQIGEGMKSLEKMLGEYYAYSKNETTGCIIKKRFVLTKNDEQEFILRWSFVSNMTPAEDVRICIKNSKIYATFLKESGDTIAVFPALKPQQQGSFIVGVEAGYRSYDGYMYYSSLMISVTEIDDKIIAEYFSKYPARAISSKEMYITSI